MLRQIATSGQTILLPPGWYKERDVSDRCKSDGEVLWRCDDYCAHGLGWEGWMREFLFCRIHQKDVCKKRKKYL